MCDGFSDLLVRLDVNERLPPFFKTHRGRVGWPAFVPMQTVKDRYLCLEACFEAIGGVLA